MNAQEHEANRDLQQLDDARCLGLIAPADYRRRRRQVLARLGGPARPEPPESPAAPPRAGARVRPAALLVLLAALAVLSWWLIR